MSKHNQLRLYLFAVISLLSLYRFATKPANQVEAQAISDCGTGLIQVCLYNGSPIIPYTKKCFNADTVLSEPGGPNYQGSQDIIPPISSQSFSGQNWTSQNETIWNNACFPDVCHDDDCQPTSVDCQYHWGQCSVECGGGVQELIIDVKPENGGKECPKDTTIECNTHECPSDPTPTFTPTPTNTPVPTPTPTTKPGDNPGGDEPDKPGPPVCNDAKPGTPTNLTATVLSATSVKLDWTHASGPHTSYLVAFGPTLGNYPYGSPNIGNDNTYIVNDLAPNARYCFYIQAQNGCMPGDPSEPVCINQPVGGQPDNVLGQTDNYNPLVDGIRQSYGGMVLGQSTQLTNTAEVKYSSQKLPSGNLIDASHTISIPKIGLNESVYIPQKIGDELTVGHGEVLADGDFYYGHNATDVFGSLYKLNIGDTITITDNGQTQTYLIETKLFVHQSQTDAVNADTEGQIILMTCSYTQPDHRIIVKATPQNQ